LKNFRKSFKYGLCEEFSMNLENIFNKVDPVKKEKKINLINNTLTYKELLALFNETCETLKEFNKMEARNEYYRYSRKLLGGYNLNSRNVSRLGEKLYEEFKKTELNEVVSIFISAMIQSSFEKGHNNFEFGVINLPTFGFCLEGEERRKLKIKMKKILGDDAFFNAKYLDIVLDELSGQYAFMESKNITLKCKRLNSYASFLNAEFCEIETFNLNDLYPLMSSKSCKLIIVC